MFGIPSNIILKEDLVQSSASSEVREVSTATGRKSGIVNRQKVSFVRNVSCVMRGGRASGRGGRGNRNGQRGHGRAQSTASSKESKSGLCKALEHHVFDYGS